MLLVGPWRFTRGADAFDFFGFFHLADGANFQGEKGLQLISQTQTHDNAHKILQGGHSATLESLQGRQTYSGTFGQDSLR
jgi:hypothetical protein